MYEEDPESVPICSQGTLQGTKSSKEQTPASSTKIAKPNWEAFAANSAVLYKEMGKLWFF